MKNRHAFASCLSALPLILAASTGRAAVIQVPQDYPTIQAALAAAMNADTVMVSPGTYFEKLNFQGKDVDLVSVAGPATTIIDGSMSQVVVIGPGGKLRGFTVTHGANPFGGGMAVSGSGTVIDGNVFVENFQGAGGFGAAIAMNSASPVISRNRFQSNHCDAQFLSGVVGAVNSSSPRIENNIFENNPCRGINLTLPTDAMPSVYNNTLVGNDVGIRVDRGVPCAAQIFSNNLLYGNMVGLSVDFGADANNPTWQNNLVFDNGTDYETISSQTGLAGNLSMDPLFVAPTTFDYHLQPGSPAIDTGMNMGAPALDFDGLPRPVDGNGDSVATVDIGAYEHVPPTPPPDAGSMGGAGGAGTTGSSASTGTSIAGTTSTGGAGGAGTTGGSGGAGAQQTPAGCGCRLHGQEADGSLGGGLLLLAGLAGAARRRRAPRGRSD